MELCVQSGIEMRVKPEITMAINNILAAPILSAISALLCLNTCIKLSKNTHQENENHTANNGT